MTAWPVYKEKRNICKNTAKFIILWYDKFVENHTPLQSNGMAAIPKMLYKQDPNYRKDTEPFISCFCVLTYNTSFQYLSIYAMSVIACYNWQPCHTFK